MGIGFGDVVLCQVVMEHLDQSIEASVDPEHRHMLRTELRAAESHVNGLVEALRKAPGSPETKVQLEAAVADVGRPEPGKVGEWLHALTRSLRGSSTS